MKRHLDGQLIGVSAAMRLVHEEIDRISATDAKVLVVGETGVGKELVARSIHTGSRRADKPFVAVNCAGLPETLLESELFGHVKGSFTGAFRDKPGKLELADRGTIFLDEIGEMTLRMQGLLLRFLETGELQKVGGGHHDGRVDVRVVAATNRNLQEMIAAGTFREDLFYRLNVIHFRVPALRERREDIPALVQHFMTVYGNQNGNNGNGSIGANGNGQGANGNARHGSIVKTISPEALNMLTAYSWPGNVRELENVIERLTVTGRSVDITPQDLPHEILHFQAIHHAPRKERRRTVADDLYKKLIAERQSFWVAVYPLYMQREITKQNVREVVRKGLEEARGNYKIVARLFNLEAGDYKRFLNFLRKHDCQLPFKEYRQ
ncbi:MAG TPA: sigma 54-interacting transcriptional regulator [Vicinamibacterales bacterium]|jgi:transcriptional regulator with PAS, ATPase and Fis domain|nr:sigma 54-interacting transcriptional regulator [Vicinamibacterales bacterium]HEX2462475.1 sigma 54-interacting transcriptional regulator [Vicinamibacterales bacterium]